MDPLIYTLLAYINNSLNKDINYSIARSFLDNVDKIHEFSLEEVAETCNVAPSTINRFCKRIGFNNFSNLRNSVILIGKSEDSFQNILDTTQFNKQLQENVEIIDNIPTEQIERIVSLISRSNRMILLSFEKHQVQTLELQKKLLLAGKFCECYTNLFKQIDDLDALTEMDMSITISIQGNILGEDFPVIEKIRATKGKKLLITFSTDQQHLDIFDEVLVCGKSENSAVSSHTLLRLFDVLVNWIHHYSNRV